MEKDGAQNVMKFLAKVKNIVARLDKAGSAPNNTDIMEVMKLGINQDIFESIVDMADNGHYATHQQLRKAILIKSAKPKQAKLLQDLDPTSQEHTLATRGVPVAKAPPSFSNCDTSINSHIEIKRLQERIVSLKQGAPPARRQRPRVKSQRCYDHAEGKCKRGDACRFVHKGVAGSGPPRPQPTPHPAGTPLCAHHGTNTHTTRECSAIRNRPDLQEKYKNELAQADVHITQDYDFQDEYTPGLYIPDEHTRLEEQTHTIRVVHVAHLDQGIGNAHAHRRMRSETCVDSASTSSHTPQTTPLHVTMYTLAACSSRGRIRTIIRLCAHRWARGVSPRSTPMGFSTS